MSAADRVRAAYRAIEAADRPEVWITLREEEDAAASAVDGLPLSGVTLAVKDNIDVAGLPTTAACPAFAYTPSVSAPAVQRLVDAGAVVLGKTNLDQFATGLVGTRSPYGAVRDARRPEYVSGGSSSGSAVAVAMGMADIGVTTDTAGSGRIPAAFQGLVGLKPTRGLVSTRGVVPACASLDCVGVFARTLHEAEVALATMADWPDGMAPAAPRAPRVGVAPGMALPEAERLAAAGIELVEVDIEPLLEIGALLYGGAFVAERHAAVGAFVEAHPDEVDPVVREIILAAGRISGSALAADQARVAAFRLPEVDALLLPTAPFQPTIAEVEADPIGVNAQLGRYTTFTNLLDLCAVTVPTGAQLLGPRNTDRVLADLARVLVGGEPGPGPQGIELLVVGAHRAGQPLNHQLTDRGARFVATVRTAPRYRLFALATEPPKPGLVRAEPGAAIEGELWALTPAGLADFLHQLPNPMTLGRVQLSDREVVGFLCEPIALEGAEDITAFGSWLAYRA